MNERTRPTRSRNQYANSFPALWGELVKEGHARYCRDNGHATYKFNGKVSDYCPRCGESANPNK